MRRAVGIRARAELDLEFGQARLLQKIPPVHVDNFPHIVGKVKGGACSKESRSRHFDVPWRLELGAHGVASEGHMKRPCCSLSMANS